MKSFLGFFISLGLLCLIVALVIGVPLAVIWSLNTLFPVLAIEYTITTWVAVLILLAAIQARVTVKK